MEEEERKKPKLGQQAWEKRMKEMMESTPAEGLSVPEGYCKMGCNRPVCPGKTASLKPFQTCCRGCASGFGHDLICGKVDATKLGEGRCKLGCGRPCAEGAMLSGKKFDTCCRLCAKGDHTGKCNENVGEDGGGMTNSNDAGPPKVQMCTDASGAKAQCGRKAAVGPDGRQFKTCCRDCTKSSGAKHSKDCEATNIV